MRATEPELLAFSVVVDLAELGALLLVAAAEAVGESRRLAVVGVVGGDVASMAALVRLHAASALDRARVAACPLLSAPATAHATSGPPPFTSHHYPTSPNLIEAHLT